MHRADVIPNTYLIRKWQQKLYAIHRERVCNPRAFFPRISPEAKSVIKRHKSSLKKLEQHNRKNGSFVERLPQNSLREYNSNYSIPVNNLKYQMSEMYRITVENVRLLKNLINKQSEYDFQKCRQDEKVRRKYIKLRCMYPPSIKRTKKQPHSRANKKTLTIQNSPIETKDFSTTEQDTETLLYEINNYPINKQQYDIKLYTLKNNLIINIQNPNTNIEKTLDEHEGILLL